MKNEPMKGFFARWPSGIENANAEKCLTDFEWDKLIKFGYTHQEPEDLIRINKHLEICEHCKELVHFMEESSHPARYLQDFLAMTKKNAQAERRAQQASLLTYIKAYFSVGSLRWKTRFIAVSAVLLLIVGVLSYKYEFQDRNNQPIRAYFGEDKYQPAIEYFTDSIDKLSTATARISPDSPSIRERPVKNEETNKRLGDLNEMLRRNELDPEQRAEVANTIATYNIEVGKYNEIVRHIKQNPNSTSKHPVMAATTPDLAVVDKLYDTVDQAAKKNGDAAEHRIEPEREIISSSPSKEVKVIAIKPDVLEVKDLIPNRSSEEQAVLKKSIRSFAMSSKYYVQLNNKTDSLTFTPNGDITTNPRFPKQ